jgi:hypothetical protein
MNRMGAFDVAREAVVSLRDWAGLVSGLACAGALPTRTVIVPSEAFAHALRRELVLQGSANVLFGTRFTDLRTLAREVLEGADIAVQSGEEGLRAVRVRAALSATRGFRYFADLGSTHGWDVAFARTFRDLEEAGLGPEDLTGTGEPRIDDLSAIWRSVLEAAGPSWTEARCLCAAAGVLAGDPSLWVEQGPSLAIVDGHETAVTADFLGAIPRLMLGVCVARPQRVTHVARVRLLFGDSAAEALARPLRAPAAGSERDLLVAFLLEPPETVMATERLRSKGPDGSVDLEEHSGVEEELEAAVAWVSREVVERSTPLEEIAILTPVLDPIAGLLADRLATLPWTGGALPVHVMRGLPIAASAAGARILCVLRALRSHLYIDQLVDVVPALRMTTGARLSRAAAVETFSALGTVGGTEAQPAHALAWRARIAFQRERLALQCAQGTGNDVSDAERRRRRLEALTGIEPAIAQLTVVAEAVVDEASLGEIWTRLRELLQDFVRLPGAAGRVVLAQLEGTMATAAADAAWSGLSGHEALAWIEQQLLGLRQRVGRFGEPAITVATLADAAGLAFRSVRVLGLAEGVLPSNAREDAVLPDSHRARWPRLNRATSRSLAQLHALDRVVQNCGERIVLSAPRMTLEGTYREPSPVLLEAAVALGRPRADNGAAAPPIPDAHALQRDYLSRACGPAGPALRERARLREGTMRLVPGRWLREAHLDPRATRAIDELYGGAMDGFLGAQLGESRLPGMSAERPISASRLGVLLSCAHRFLLQAVLGWTAPPARPSEGAIDALAYGDLFHRAAETFYREHGVSFVARRRTLGEWQVLADAAVGILFDDFLATYPLTGKSVRAAQRARLQRDFRALLEHDWESEAKMFVDVERSFGVTAPLALDFGDRALHVHGFIDRIDEIDGATRVWDLKTGKAHPRKPNVFDPPRDIQLALYGSVAQRKAGEWGTAPRVVAAYVYPSGQGERERAFATDFDALRDEGKAWMETSAGLLAERTFPRTPLADDCTFCAFKPVCGTNISKRAATVLENAQGPALAFRKLKTKETE